MANIELSDKRLKQLSAQCSPIHLLAMLPKETLPATEVVSAPNFVYNPPVEQAHRAGHADARPSVKPSR